MIGGLFRRWGLQATPLRTERMQLVAITPAMLNAETVGPRALERELGSAVPKDWPPEHWEPQVWAHILAQFRAQPETFGWHRYMVSREDRGEVVGCLGGFPCAHGDVELGYSVVDAQQRRGLGTEAVQALTAWLLRRPEVQSVSAQAFETVPGSIKVMQRCGMRPVGAGDQPGTVRYRRWRGARATE